MKVSIIVPIYNVQIYLRECLESLINQAFDDYEIILINDGSTDNSGTIAEEYENNYKNIILINTMNSGLSSARNTGIKNANGEYLVFVDSDDYVSSDYISSLYNSIIKDDSDIAICSFERIKNSENEIEIIELNENISYTNIDILENILSGTLQCHAWNKMYKRELFLLNKIDYPIGKLYEDISTLIKLVIKSKRISFINKPLYKYRIREGSITYRKGKKEAKDYIYAIDDVNRIIKSCGLMDKLSKELINFNIMYSLGVLDIISVYTQYSNTKFYNEYKKRFKNDYFDYSIIEVLNTEQILHKVKRDFILFKFRLLCLKNKVRDKRRSS